MTELRTIDSTLAFAWHGYDYVRKQAEQHDTQAFRTRLLLEPTVCIRGAEAAELFYDRDKFERQGAFPMRVQRTLVGVGGVQGLDGPAHLERKRMFVDLMTPERVDALAQLATDRWRDRIPHWQDAGEIILFDEVGQILCGAVSDWVGVPVSQSQLADRTDDLHALIDAPAAVGPRHWRGRVARRRAERGLARLVERVRTGAHTAPKDSPLETLASHRDIDGTLMDSRVAAVELLNLLRPTVAVDRFVVFAALALHDHPEWRDRIRDGEDRDAEMFLHEVRRFYPFFPVAGARARRHFEWRGLSVERGERVLLDLYGTNHDPSIWDHPDQFRPERFASGEPGPYELIPQGGGDHRGGHRCPGEWNTIAVMKAALHILTREMSYQVPEQDLRVSHRRMPTQPKSGFIMREVRQLPVS